MQVFLYAWLYASETGESKIQPAVYYTRDLFKGSFDPTIRRTIEKETTVVDDFETYRESFEDNLRMCIDEMFNAGKPFIQTSNIKSCEYCPFTGVCGR